MITAMEIRNHQFNKSLRGFNQNEVKNFLIQLAQEYENLYSENAALKDNLRKLEGELDRYHKLEETMNNSLIFAQQAAEDMKASARKESDLILEDAKRRIAEVLMIYQEVIKRLGVFSAELKAQIGGHMEMMESNQKKVEELSQFFYSRDLKEMLEKLEKININEANA
ncbi:MAG: DivIVA domain-containing protein [Syntrophomonadaceae bacterium]|jgi:cell division initiation protein